MGVHRSGVSSCFPFFWYLRAAFIHNSFIARGFYSNVFFCFSLLLHYFISASSILHIPCQLIGSTRTARAVVQSVKTRKSTNEIRKVKRENAMCFFCDGSSTATAGYCGTNGAHSHAIHTSWVNYCDSCQHIHHTEQKEQVPDISFKPQQPIIITDHSI